MSSRGPYMNEDGDWWVAVEDAPTLREARAEVLSCLSYSIPEDGTLIYRGRVQVTLCDGPVGEHEVGPSCSDECRRDALAWHFVENRRW